MEERRRISTSASVAMQTGNCSFAREQGLVSLSCDMMSVFTGVDTTARNYMVRRRYECKASEAAARKISPMQS